MDSAASAKLRPVRFEPILLEKVWGGRRLARWGKPIAPDARVGESWEIADLANTTTGGGGGGQARTRIADGPFKGSTPRELIAKLGPALLGASATTPEGDFPLLIKFLDAREHLSVQVHPSPAYAAANPGAALKSECWHVLEAEASDEGPPVIFRGLRKGVTREQFERALRTGDGSGVVELLERVEAKVGDCHTLPSGTLHALGAGVLVAEVQTPSDTTFRVYDWTREYRRPRRDMHVEEALACIDFQTPVPPARRLDAGAAGGAGTGRTLVAATPYFRVWSCRGPGAIEPETNAGGPSFVVVISLSDGVRWVGGAGEELALPRGSTTLVPAALVRASRVETPARAEYLLVQAGNGAGER